MTIIESVHDIRIASTDARSIAYDTYYALKDCCRDHWVKHPNAFLENEKDRIGRMKTFFILGNAPDLFDHFLKELETIVRSKEN